MSAFKFACPVCGQHITCDSSSSGAQMDCPTCFRKLIVPQATTPSSGNFVLTAAEVQTRPVALPENADTTNVTRPRRSPVAAIALGMLFVGAAAAATIYFVTTKERRANAGEEPAPPSLTTNRPRTLVLPRAAPGATNWTLNLAEARIPEAPASGAVNGFDFKLERATIQGGRLDLRQGAKWPPDVGVSIHLFAERAEDLAGRIVVLEATRTNAPRVLLRWKNPDDKAQTKEYRQGYAARVEFGPVTNNR